MLENLIRKISVVLVSIILLGCGDSGEPGTPSDTTYKEGKNMRKERKKM